MRRQSVGKHLALTERDLEIFKLLDRYRYLSSTFLYAFLGGNRTRFIERLGDLFHEGYIGRPVQQWAFANARYSPVVYDLDRKGQGALSEYASLDGNGPCSMAARGNGSRQFAHRLMVAECVASIALAARATPDLRFIDAPEILERAPAATRQRPNPLGLPVSFAYTMPKSKSARRVDMTLLPDALFGLEYAHAGKKAYRFFAVEADRAQMPVMRRTAAPSSYLKKFLAYREIAARGLAKEHLGVPNLLVLTVTTGERHMRTMMTCLDELTSGKGSMWFLFKTVPVDAATGRLPAPALELLAEPWGRVGHAPLRIDVP